MTILQAFVAIVTAFLGGGAVMVAIINSRTERWKFKATRQAEKEDRAEEKKDAIDDIYKHMAKFEGSEIKKNEEIDESLKMLSITQTSQCEALKLILLDRILRLGRAYIADGEIDFDDRRRLHEMHDVYHNALNGNGDARLVMEAVDGLPLKKPT